jgi:hypothetical protein
MTEAQQEEQREATHQRMQQKQQSMTEAQREEQREASARLVAGECNRNDRA